MTPRPGRPSSWRTMTDTGCAYSVRLIEQGAPYDRAIFGAGTAAHAYIEAHYRGQDPEAAVVALSVLGRAGAGHVPSPDDEPEPPIPLDQAMAGADLARRWLRACGDQIPADAQAEVPIALTADWRAAAWDDPAVAHRTVLDLVWTEEEHDEETGEAAAVVRVLDHKSSWRAALDADAVTSVQRRYQALAALAAYPEADVVIVGISALRTWGTHWIAPIHREHDADLLDGWRREIAALEATRHAARPAPGAGCAVCPVRLSCEAAEVPTDDEVTRYVRAVGEVRALEPMLRRAASEQPIEVPGGGTIGYAEGTGREPAEGAFTALLDLWRPSGWGEYAEAVRSLLEVMAPGVQALDRALKIAIPGRGAEVKAEREAAGERLFSEIARRTWKISPKDG